MFIEPGLPNIIGSFGVVRCGYYGGLGASGAFSVDSYYSTGIKGSSNGDNWGYNLTLNAQKSSIIYGASTTVQPAAYTVYFIIKIS